MSLAPPIAHLQMAGAIISSTLIKHTILKSAALHQNDLICFSEEALSSVGD